MEGIATRPVGGSLRIKGNGRRATIYIEEPQSLDHYDPLNTHAALYVEFGNLPLGSDPESVDQIARFLQQYGFLRFTGDCSEPITTWHREIRAMRRALDLWAFQSGRGRPVASTIRLSADMVVYVDPQGDQVTLAESGQALFPGMKSARVSQIAQYALERIINLGLESRISTFVTSEPLAVQNMVLQVTYRGLAGAIWLQLATDAANSNPPRTCSECGRISVPKNVRQIYCSDYCRVKHHRRTRKQL
ncbi:MAG: hypothetical protein AB7O54_00810 [Pseudomonadales bacterium]